MMALNSYLEVLSGHIKRRLLIIGLALAVIPLLGVWGCKSPPPLEEEPSEGETTPHPPAWHLMRESVFLWENGKEQFIAGVNSPMSSLLFQTLHRLNLQAKCWFSEEEIKEIKENDRVIELRFRHPERIVISQWTEPEDRDHIKTDENGYRILDNVKSVLFILEDNLDEGLETHILVGSRTEGWGCWAIQQEGSNELDKTWINEIEKILPQE